MQGGVDAPEPPSGPRIGPGPDGAVRAGLPPGVSGLSNVLGLALVYGSGGVGAVPRSAGGSGIGITSIVAVTGLGRTVRIDATGGAGPDTTLETVFHYHYGTMWATCGENKTGSRGLFATGGDDKWLIVWDNTIRQMVCKIKVEAPIHSLDVYSYNASNTAPPKANTTGAGPGKPLTVAEKRTAALKEGSRMERHPKSGEIASEACYAVGMAGGCFSIVKITGYRRPPTGASAALFRGTGDAIDYVLTPMAYRKDHSEDVSVIRYSPNGKMLAVGSKDQYIDLYSHSFTLTGPLGHSTLELKLLKRLRGHTASITHLDWSAENRLLKSNCSSYELL